MNLREAYREAHHFCEACGAVATELHHIVARAHGKKTENVDNYMMLCNTCHSEFHCMGRWTWCEKWPHLLGKVEKATGRTYVVLEPKVHGGT